MSLIRSIVAATDFSRSAQTAVEFASELASQFKAELHLLTAVSVPFADFADECQMNFGTSIDDTEQELVRAAQRQLAEVDTGSVPIDSVHRVVRQGFPVDQINAYVSSIGASLLVIGTHGVTGLQHVLLGSIAERVVRTAGCPVISVRQGIARADSPSTT